MSKDLKEKNKKIYKFDLTVIGSGPAGVTAAIQAAKLQKKVCIVEKNPEKLGGSWIFWGTLPSKTLRESLETIDDLNHHLGEQWMKRVRHGINADKIFGQAHDVSKQEKALVEKYIEKNKIQLIEGLGSIEDEHHVRVKATNKDPILIQTKYILIATGSKPGRPENIPFDSWRVIDSDDIFQLDSIPRSILIFGAGVIGCEYACMFRSLGAEVIVADSRKRILRFLDNEISEELKKSMENSGIKFNLDTTLKKIEINGNPKVVSSFKQKTYETDIFLYSAGRISSTDRLGLEKLNIKKDKRGAIEVNSNFQTSHPNIYAAGDAIGAPALTSTSGEQGRHVACHAFGHSIGGFPKVYPFGVYTIPELSMVGKTEEQLKKEKYSYIVGKASYNEIARGHIRKDPYGLIKILVCKKTHKLIGVHIVGADACNLIHIGQSIMIKGGYVQDLVNMIYNYPTLAEGYKIAAFNALNKIFLNGVIKAPPTKKTTS
jgi:NAD(P) transhydrogenase